MLGSHRNPTEQSPLLLAPPSWLVLCGLFLQNMWIERTIYTTAYKLPGILRWFEVKSVFMVRRLLRRKYLPSSLVVFDRPSMAPRALCSLWPVPCSVPVSACHHPARTSEHQYLSSPPASYSQSCVATPRAIWQEIHSFSHISNVSRSCIALTGLLSK